MEIPTLWAWVMVATAIGVVELFMLLRVRRTREISARRVDEYVLSVEERNGFHFVQLKLQTNDGSATYELDPNYSHVLSDELLATSAKAIRSAHAPSH
jgi:hypothetical protein